MRRDHVWLGFVCSLQASEAKGVFLNHCHAQGPSGGCLPAPWMASHKHVALSCFRFWVLEVGSSRIDFLGRVWFSFSFGLCLGSTALCLHGFCQSVLGLSTLKVCHGQDICKLVSLVGHVRADWIQAQLICVPTYQMTITCAHFMCMPFPWAFLLQAPRTHPARHTVAARYIGVPQSLAMRSRIITGVAVSAVPQSMSVLPPRLALPRGFQNMTVVSGNHTTTASLVVSRALLPTVNDPYAAVQGSPLGRLGNLPASLVDLPAPGCAASVQTGAWRSHFSEFMTINHLAPVCSPKPAFQRFSTASSVCALTSRSRSQHVSQWWMSHSHLHALLCLPTQYSPRLSKPCSHVFGSCSHWRVTLPFPFTARRSL